MVMLLLAAACISAVRPTCIATGQRAGHAVGVSTHQSCRVARMSSPQRLRYHVGMRRSQAPVGGHPRPCHARPLPPA